MSDIRYQILLLLLLTPTFAFAKMRECSTLYYSQNEKAFEVCLPFAEDGDADTQKIIGDMYYWGWGNAVSKDYKQALQWYKKSAVNGNTEAKYSLGVLYEQGKGTETNYAKSVQWLRSASMAGHATAQYNLANMYSKGAGVTQNHFHAFKWYSKAAAQGEPSAQYNLGNRYALGKGVKQDVVEAYKWYLLARERGDDAAGKNIEFLKKTMTKEEISRAEFMATAWRQK